MIHGQFSNIKVCHCVTLFCGDVKFFVTTKEMKNYTKYRDSDRVRNIRTNIVSRCTDINVGLT